MYSNGTKQKCSELQLTVLTKGIYSFHFVSYYPVIYNYWVKQKLDNIQGHIQEKTYIQGHIQEKKNIQEKSFINSNQIHQEFTRFEE